MGTSSRRLARARKIRHRMSSELNALSNGDMNIEHALRNPSPALKRCRVYDVLRRAPHIGDKKARRLCERTKLWPHERLGSIPLKKRDELIAALPHRSEA